MMSGQPREPGCRVRDWLWEAKRVRSSVRGAKAMSTGWNAASPHELVPASVDSLHLHHGDRRHSRRQVDRPVPKPAEWANGRG